ncbi:MAG: aminotransferase class V-fold PLP-dependent enzyme, partial [Phycisphaerae bacterium]|nr:aminotransferase class V-fold PLP-dependent enzyme [Phycisphaerae bacterium]
RQKGWRVDSPRTPSEWSGIVAFTNERYDLRALKKHLRDEFRIIIAHRLNRLRASPHVYNTPEEIAQLIDALPAS